MFEKEILPDIHEISHKLVVRPETSHYTNHIHHYCEMLLFLSGDVDFNINGHLYTPRPYDLILIPQQTYHNLIPRSEKKYENYVIGFAPSLLEPDQYMRIFTPPLVVNVCDNGDFLQIFKMLDLSYDLLSEPDFARCAAAIVQQLLIFCSYLPKEADPTVSVNPVVQSIVSYIRENLTVELNAQIIADRLMFSKSYIQNVFDKAMHIGLKQYILQQKIYAAYNDIRSGTLSPTQACQKYAFQDYTSFYRLFRKTFGTSPKQILNI